MNFSPLPLTLLLAATATTTALSAAAAEPSDPASREQEKLALYRAHAQPPVDRFRYLGRRLDGWEALGDAALAIWTRPNEAYLLELDGSCSDLEFAQGVGLTWQGDTVYARFDKVIPRVKGNPHVIPCRILEIRPLDEKALKDAEREASGQGKTAKQP